MQLTDLELASGVVLGPVGGATTGDGGLIAARSSGRPSRRPVAPWWDPAGALVDAARGAVLRAPCLVSFSGGMDSSLVLAAATRAARESGAADPVPVTWRPGEAPRAQESDWQEAVVRELGLRDWLRLPCGDELDYVGAVARAVHARHGVRFPPNAHFHDPLLELAAGGTLLTGLGGDQLFGRWRWARAADLLAGRRVPTPRGVAAAALSRAPTAARSAVEQRRSPTRVPWLRPGPQAALARAIAADAAAEPARWDDRVHWQAARRRLALTVDSLARIAGDHGARIGHPLLAPAVVDAVARAGRRHGFASRNAAIHELFPGLLPAALRGRGTKALFDEVFVRAPTRQLVGDWDGGGLDAALVDPGALARRWDAGVPIHSALLLQQLALRS